MPQDSELITTLRHSVRYGFCTVVRYADGSGAITFPPQPDNAHYDFYQEIHNGFLKDRPDYFKDNNAHIKQEPRDGEHSIRVSRQFIADFGPGVTVASVSQPSQQSGEMRNGLDVQERRRLLSMAGREERRQHQRMVSEDIVTLLMEKSVWTEAKQGGDTVFFSDLDAAKTVFSAIYPVRRATLHVRDDLTCGAAAGGTTSVFYFDLPVVMKKRTTQAYQDRYFPRPDNDDNLLPEAVKKLSAFCEMFPATRQLRGTIRPNDHTASASLH